MIRHYTDVVLRNITRYFRGIADGIETEVARELPPGPESDDYWRGGVDGLRGAARHIESKWITPTGKLHDTPILKLVVDRDREEKEG
jgi:hypothetical protein